MLQVTPHHRLMLAVNPADFRRGIDGLAALCRQSLGEDPFSGAVFIFTNRSRKAVRILVFDGNGFWLVAKRFSKGRLPCGQPKISLLFLLIQANSTSCSHKATP